MTEKFSLPFASAHVDHLNSDPIDVFFGMTFVACGGDEHAPAVVTGIGEDGVNGFESAVILFDRSEQGLYLPNKISTSGTTWRDIIVTPGLSHIDSSLPDQLSVDQIYYGVLNGFGPRMVEHGSPSFLESLQMETQRGSKTVTKLTKPWSEH